LFWSFAAIMGKGLASPAHWHHPPFMDAASAMGTGWFSDFWIRHGFTATLVRKSAMAMGHTTAAIALAGCVVAGSDTYVWWLLVVGVGSGMTGSGIYAFSQILAGPKAAGRWTGFQNGFANLAGVVAPALTGLIVNRTGNFQMALAITAAVSMAGAFAWISAIGRLEQVIWARVARDLAVSAEHSA
jgi:MFS transporter, ACS family, D-galactonate transporter